MVQIEHLAAVVVATYLVFITVQRLMNDDDPSLIARLSTSVGTVSFMYTGAFVAALLATFVAVMTWPAPMDRPIFALVLVGAVAAHFIIEWREAVNA